MMALHPTKDVMKSGNFSLAKPQRTQSQKMASFSTKTGKNLAVMQGLALCFFPLPTCSEASFGKSATGRNSLRSSGLHHGKKPEKQLTPDFLLSQRKAPTGLNSQ